MSTPAPLPNPRRYVTSHNAAGQAVVLFNDEVPMISVGGSAGGVAWATEKHPAEVLGDADGAKLSLPGIVHPSELRTSRTGRASGSTECLVTQLVRC